MLKGVVAPFALFQRRCEGQCTIGCGGAVADWGCLDLLHDVLVCFARRRSNSA
jgi:hypothetical protein